LAESLTKPIHVYSIHSAYNRQIKIEHKHYIYPNYPSLLR